MPNRVDNPVAGARPEAARADTQRAERDQQAGAQDPTREEATDRVELSRDARQRTEAPARAETNAAQGVPTGEEDNASEVAEQTRNNAENIRQEQNRTRQPGQNQEPGNLVDVTG